MRIGTGYDAHRLAENRKLVLGGVLVPHERGLLGVSDADVLLHAVMDALLGAAACYVSACAFSLAGMLAHRLGRRDGIPMAPFLSIWLAVGTTVLG